METTTSFDLNRAIQHWRDGLAQSPAIRAENLDELETHLRDSVSTLQTRDLSAEESFLVATKRVGGSTALGKEFGKVNSQTIWIERALWTLVIMQLWGAVQGLGSSLAFILSRLSNIDLFYSGSNSYGLVLFYMFIATPTLGAILLSWPAWRFFKSQSWLRIKLEKLSSHPFRLAISLFVFSLAIHFFSTFLISLTMSGREHFMISNYFRTVPLELFYAGLVILLARKRLLRIA